MKNNFLAFIYNTAEAYPGANFSFIFDAVNQFSSEKDAHDMWWIPQKTTEAPKNVNFVVSTLSTESGTFENAQKVANASIIKIENMPDQDLKKLLEVTLAQYNKKLTTEQVDNIVKRASKSPLFLTAFCSDIRRAGIWEEVDLEIEKLILTSSENSAKIQSMNKLLGDKQEKYNISLSEEERDTLISRGGKNPMFLTALCSNNDKPDAKRMLNEAIHALLETSNDAIAIRKVSDRDEEYNSPVRHLFEFLIQKWSHEYGEDFMKYLLGTIAVSRDGIQENAINDFMGFLEEQEKTTFTSSFAFVYETLSTFFAGLGSGKIRFFHDQLKYAVNDFIGPKGIKYMNGKLAKFYYDKISSHLIEVQDDAVDKCSYYNDALNQIVYHCCNYSAWKSICPVSIMLENIEGTDDLFEPMTFLANMPWV